MYRGRTLFPIGPNIFSLQIPPQSKYVYKPPCYALDVFKKLVLNVTNVMLFNTIDPAKNYFHFFVFVCDFSPTMLCAKSQRSRDQFPGHFFQY